MITVCAPVFYSTYVIVSNSGSLIKDRYEVCLNQVNRPVADTQFSQTQTHRTLLLNSGMAERKKRNPTDQKLSNLLVQTIFLRVDWSWSRYTPSIVPLYS